MRGRGMSEDEDGVFDGNAVTAGRLRQFNPFVRVGVRSNTAEDGQLT
jgi:hypothetical protein